LLLSLRDLSEMYRMNAQLRSAIIRYLYDKLKNDIEDLPLGLELLELTYAGILPGQPHDLPLNVKVKGPRDISDFVLSYIQQLVQDSEQEIVTSFKNLEETGAFKDLTLIVDTYNFDDIVDVEEATTTNPPTPSTSNSPSTAPVEPVKVMETETIMKETKMVVPWWVWFIVALLILLCCICCVCFCVRRRRRASDKKDIQGGQQINVTARNREQRIRDPTIRKPKRASDESDVERGFNSTIRYQRPPRSVAQSRRTRHTKRVERGDDQSRRKRNARHSARTVRSHKTRSSHAPRTQAPATVIEISKVEAELETKATRAAKTRPPKELDVETAVSALSTGFDPDDEHAIVLYKPNPQARDPTYYTDRMMIPDQVDPEGSMADASLMSEVRREREEFRKEREAKNARAGWRDNMEMSRESLLPDPDEEKFEDDQAYYQSEMEYFEAEEPNEEMYGYSHPYDQSDKVLSDPEGAVADDLKFTKSKKKTKRKSRNTRRLSLFELSEQEMSTNLGCGLKDSDDDSPSIRTKPPPEREHE